MEPFIDAYTVLGVPEDADEATLKSAHRKLAWRYHPDRVPGEARAAATQRIQEINLAWALVRTPTARARYDRLRRARATASTPSGASVPGEGGWGSEWDELMRRAGRWAGLWWQRNEGPIRRTAGQAATGARRTYVRVTSTLTTVVYAWLGLILGAAAQQLSESANVLPTIVGGLGGAIAGMVQARDRTRALDGHPLMRRPWIPVAAWLFALGAAIVLSAR